MKKLTKLINGSVVVFVICLMVVLTLTSCNNTNNHNLIKEQDTNIEEIQGDAYKVTEVEFNKAISLESFTNFKYERYENGNDKSNMTVYRYEDKLKYNDYEPCLVSEIIKVYDRIPLLPNIKYSKFTYDDKKKQYVYTENDRNEQYIIKFKNKKIVEYDENDENGTTIRQHIIEYGVVKPSDVI